MPTDRNPGTPVPGRTAERYVLGKNGKSFKLQRMAA